MNLQTTINSPISCYGLGMHSGRMCQMTLKPAKQGSGIVFVRTDVTEIDNAISANYQNVAETTLATTISNASNVKVATIEHLMAALYSFKIDNIIIEIDGPEIPIMDGSSRPFMFMLYCSGVTELNAKRKKIKILKEILVENQDSFIQVEPAEDLKIEASIDFFSKAIGKQHMIYDQKVAFEVEIASARTFGFINDLRYLNSKGLGLGINLQNAIGIDQNDNLLTELRFKDEFVRHKILDCIGDFYTAGDIEGHFKCHKSGHYLNNQILRKIFSDPSNYIYI
jgi:UDP-3-O-[3-hydroxymyristoyl] N-acetylglucosamine deacetylase